MLSDAVRKTISWRTIVATMVALLLLPIEASDAGLLDFLKPKQDKSARRAAPTKPAVSPKPAASPKRHVARKAERKQVTSKPPPSKPSSSKPSLAKAPLSKPLAPTCNPAKFRIVVDVGHTAES